MAGISSKALKFPYTDNKNGYNGNELQTKEFSDGSGLDLYDFNARTYDQQIGRFIQIDPEFENFDQESLSPYHFAKNDPVRYNDPTGRCPDCPGFVAPAIPFILEGLATLIDAAIVFFASNETGKQISKIANSPNPQAALTSFDMNVGSNLGVPTGSTFRKLYTESTDQNSDNKAKQSEQAKTGISEEKKVGREKNKLEPDKEAKGDHTTFKRDDNGNVFKYQLWKENERNPNGGFDAGKRFDGGKPDGSAGKPHINKKTGQPISTPHVNEKKGARIPGPAELPQNSRFIPEKN